MLSRNEINREYAYNRSLFLRVGSGRYQFNPKLAVRHRQGNEEDWIPIFTALNLPLISEFAYHDGWISTWGNIDQLLSFAGLSDRTIPIAAERLVEREAAKIRELEERKANRLAAEMQLRAAAEAKKQSAPRWGTKDAKRLEIERVRQEIENRKKAIGSSDDKT